MRLRFRAKLLISWSPPPPLARATRWWVEPTHVGWSNSWWLEVSHTVWVEAILREALSIANFRWRWPLAYFAIPNRCFGFLYNGKVTLGVEASQFVEVRYLSPISGESGLESVMCCLVRVYVWPCRCVSRFCCWMYRRFFFWQSRQVFQRWRLVLAILAVQSKDSLGQNSLFQSSQVARINC